MRHELIVQCGLPDTVNGRRVAPHGRGQNELRMRRRQLHRFVRNTGLLDHIMGDILTQKVIRKAVNGEAEQITRQCQKVFGGRRRPLRFFLRNVRRHVQTRRTPGRNRCETVLFVLRQSRWSHRKCRDRPPTTEDNHNCQKVSEEYSHCCQCWCRMVRWWNVKKL